ncbi:MAG: hypothetical protein WBA81_05595 [Rhodococcus sp. (in: high G+C Gram-positive bacteria)]
MYETKSGTKLAIPNGVFTALLAGTLLNGLVLVAACASICAMWVLVAGYELAWIASIRDWAWLTAGISLVAVFLYYWAVYFASTSVAVNSKVALSMWVRTLVRSRWGSTTLAWWCSLVVLFTSVKYVDSHLWGGALYVSVCTALAAVAAVALAASTRELVRAYRRSGWSPLITDGVDLDYTEHEAFSIDSAWRAAGSDWVAPNAILDVRTAVRYAKLAQSRSAVLLYVGKGLAWLCGFLAITALVWSLNENVHPSAAAVPAIPASLVLLGYVVERRSRQLERLVTDYAEVARALLAQHDDADCQPAPRLSAGQRMLRRLRLAAKTPVS